jgi:hypothetical protein
MTPAEVTAQAAIRAQYGAPVAYTGAGLADDTVTAIRTDAIAAQYQGFEGAPTRISFEIDKEALPERPRVSNRIVEGGGSAWSVIDVDFQAGINSWVLGVEEAA